MKGRSKRRRAKRPPLLFAILAVSTSLSTPIARVSLLQMPEFSCRSSACTANFGSRRDLSVHETACQHAQAVEASKAARRKARAQAAREAELETRRRRLHKSAFSDSPAQYLHFSPFELRHSTSGDAGDSQRLHGELYTSDAFLKAHDEVQRHGLLPEDDPHCTRERMVAALQFASDGTHLANFGNAKAWPIYVMLGNLSKYIRAVPTSGALYHLAYIPSLPSSFAAFGEATCPKWKTQQRDITTHCRRDPRRDEFLKAYKYGIVVRCLDGIERRVYPRIFTYSADYPEKVLLATIRDGGLCPCPRCLVPKTKLDRLGLVRDMATRVKNARQYLADRVAWARRAIYDLARPIAGKAVEAILKPFSAVPTKNAFADRLGSDFNPSDMLVVDLLHEFELGVWKAIFTHLIRILYAADPKGSLVTELNKRYRLLEAFGRGTIRKFAEKENVSDMKKLAARDFEDLLQCALPCFDGLLPAAFNRKLQNLLYRTAEWHAAAKLRMHTDATLVLLDELTREFGKLAREFEELSAVEFKTVETPKEATARARRALTKTAAAAGRPAPTNAEVAAAPKGRKPKRLNLCTYKFHALGDYVQTIKTYGTTDSYSTQMARTPRTYACIDLTHACRLYQLTNKKDAMVQVAKKYERVDFFRQAEKFEMKDLAKASLKKPYVISDSTSDHFDMPRVFPNRVLATGNSEASYDKLAAQRAAKVAAARAAATAHSS
ncbi:hypothetical protein EV715DRAFT_268357 [Schizophyllum commune]